MQLEEKVLSWIMDSWGVGDGQTIRGNGGGNGGRSRMLLYTIDDILVLLESVCGLSKRSNLISRVLLPDCLTMETMVDHRKTKIIRDFQLDGCLPPFRKVLEKSKAATTGATASVPPPSSIVSGDLSQPRGRERRISTYLLRSLEALASDFDSTKDRSGHPTAEKARRALDLAVISLSFESLLILNGTRSTRRVIQAACKLTGLVTALLPDPRWTLEEKALILLALEPLIAQGNEGPDEIGWEAILPPDTGAGIKTQTLRHLLSHGQNQRVQLQALRRNFQRTVFQSADVSNISPYDVF
jgi:ataxia telangiectasia mutated family protein